jgi:hypothetical protein
MSEQSEARAARQAGEGTITQLPSGRWRVRVPVAGKRRSIIVDTPEEAERARVALAHEATEQRAHAWWLDERELPEPAPHPGASVIYFVRARKSGMVKIGVTRNLPVRLAAIRTSVECELLALVPGDVKTEAAIHRQFGAQRAFREWFRPSPALLAYIEKLRWGR